ncbi:hypothetical protein [Shewanella colwelliana]|uniref:hypothetical protein n=1 Tax=Shewanella colwelliana TaxID=23 RepID=UPI0022B00015|nr:hypothetical protein [Shewanella colwelliana]MCZ4338677.1 hypothetical protein [Shewanella colwelliana]
MLPRFSLVNSPLIVGLLSSSMLLSSVVNAMPDRHIADPLNLNTALGMGLDTNGLTIGGQLGFAQQRINATSALDGDTWQINYLYSPLSSGQGWHFSAGVEHNHTYTQEGKFNHYRYRLGAINETNLAGNIKLFSQLSADYVDIEQQSQLNNGGANLSFTFLKVWNERWYNQLIVKGTMALDGHDRYQAGSKITLGYRLSRQWSWELAYRYDFDKVERVENEETSWVFGVRSQF